MSRGTRTLRLDADPETTAMVMHAAARGAVHTPIGIGALIGWPVHGSRCTVHIKGGHTRPLKALVDPIVCADCAITPADPAAAAAGMRLCHDCAIAHQHAN